VLPRVSPPWRPDHPMNTASFSQELTNRAVIHGRARAEQLAGAEALRAQLARDVHSFAKPSSSGSWFASCSKAAKTWGQNWVPLWLRISARA
jgi:hypothetical protein